MTALPGPTAVIGAGSWGTALALLLARCQQDILLWSGEPGHAQAMAKSQSNEAYLPGIPLEPRITPSDNFEEAANASRLVLAVPSHAFRAVLTQLKEHLPRDKRCYICWGTKGFEPDSSLLLSDVFEEVMDENAVPAVVSGPSFAGEVARGLPSALTVAAAKDDDACAVASWFRDARTRVYTSTDLRGVQLGGAIKRRLRRRGWRSGRPCQANRLKPGWLPTRVQQCARESRMLPPRQPRVPCTLTLGKRQELLQQGADVVEMSEGPGPIGVCLATEDFVAVAGELIKETLVFRGGFLHEPGKQGENLVHLPFMGFEIRMDTDGRRTHGLRD